ncbi:hypothetical protein ACIOV9_12720 [Pseudomonas iridis]|uniref:hypothetical protein n=1 Tax=Pseudomonas iridis TaxID=2710587 RepID=UPI00382DB8A8
MRDVFPGSDGIYEEYRSLPRRELAVVVGAVLDSALAELLSKRLTGQDSEIHSFLGVNGDGRAPCGSFGARIQLALLTSVITAGDAAVLRTIKNIRNQFAHQVNADFNTESVLPLLTKLCDQFQQRSNNLIEIGYLDDTTHSLSMIKPLLVTEPEAGAGLLLAIVSTYQAYFHLLYERVQPIPPFPVVVND